MNAFKYISNIDKNKDFAEMFIYDEIGYNPNTGMGISGRQFAYELKWLADYHEPPLKKIKVRLNTGGGSVMDGFSIFSAIHNINKEGNLDVDTYNDGVAASIGGLILMAGKNRFAKDYSRLMLHGVSILDKDGNARTDISPKELEAMSNFKDMIKQVFVNNTGIPDYQIEDLLTNEKDNWFTAKEAANAGFFPTSNIENTGLELGLPVENDAFVIANKAQKIINNNYKPLEMRKVIALLNLQDGANEEVVANAVQNALTQAQETKTALTQAQNKAQEQEQEIQRLKTQVEASNKAVATGLVENAIKEGKFTPKDEAEKQSLISNALKDPEAFGNMVNMMPVKAANIINGTQIGKENTDSLISRINNRGLRELEKNDPSLLTELKNSAKDEYVKLYNKQYGTNKTVADF